MSNVVLLGPAHPLRGGLANFNESLARAFQQEGHQVRIITFSLQYPGFLFPGKSQYTDNPAPGDLDIEVAINSIHPLNWRQVGLRLKKEQPDLLIPSFWLPFMGPSLGKICGTARRNAHTKAVALVHNMIPHEPRPGDKFLSAYFTKRMDGFVALSQSVVEDIGKFDRHKPKAFHPHPIYDHFGEKLDQRAARKQLGLDPNGKYLLFFGFIRQYKGLDLLLEALAQPGVKTLDDLQLIVAGEFYDDEQPYYELIEEHRLHDRVVLKTDFIPDDEVAIYFSAADVVAQPYRSATQSGVTQIAYHFEKPMIVTNVGGLPEIVPHEKVGLVVGPNPEDIAGAIVHIFEEQRLKRFAQNAAQEKKRFSWDKMVQAFMDIYKQLQSK